MIIYKQPLLLAQLKLRLALIINVLFKWNGKMCN